MHKIVSAFEQPFSSLLSKIRIWIAISILKSNLQIFLGRFCLLVFLKHEAELLTSQKGLSFIIVTIYLGFLQAHIIPFLHSLIIA